MKDHFLKLVDYRGGKALLIDSLDIITFNTVTRKDKRELRKRIEEKMEEVDYVLMLTSFKPYMIDPLFSDLFNSKTLMFCYRVVTEKGRLLQDQLSKKMSEEMLISLKSLRKAMEKGDTDNG